MPDDSNRGRVNPDTMAKSNGVDMKSSAARLHNVKFYNLAPRAIQCLALNHKISKMALSRSDASIEIWDLRNAPFLERAIVGNKKRSIEGICWVGNELLTSGQTGQIFQWDLKTLKVKRSLMVTGNSIWCMDSHGQSIAAGTEEGYLNICELDAGLDSLTYVKVLDKQDGRILCCKFDKTGMYLVTGSLDVLRLWDVSNGHVIHKLTTGRAEAKKPTVIWSVLVLNDLQIAAADSRGRLTLWDGKEGAQIESYQCLKADALCLAVDEKAETLFVSGIEPTICSYTLTTIKKENQAVKKWVRTYSRYSHTHDVKAMAVFENNVISGGIDGFLCLTTFPEKFYLKYSPFLQRPSVTVTNNRLMLFKYDNYLELWRLGKPSKELDVAGRQGDDSGVKMNLLSLEENPVKLVELLSKKKEPIVCAAVSKDGRWMTYSTESSIRLFMVAANDAEKVELTTVTPHIPDHYSSATLCTFSQDSKQLILYKSNAEITVFELFEENGEIDFKQNIQLSKYISDLAHLMEVSSCGKYLVLASLCNNVIVYTWSVKKAGKRKAGEWQHHMTLPQYEYPAATISIHPQHTNRLVITYTNSKLIEYDLKEFSFTYSSFIPQRNYVNQSLVFEPRLNDVYLVQTEKAITSVTKKMGGGGDTKNDDESDDEAEMNVFGKKAKRTNDKEAVAVDQRNYKRRVIKEAKHLLYLTWLDEDELVSVELNPVALLEQLPPTLRLKKYGTG